MCIRDSHGGKDPGNRGNNYYEKKIALSVALKTGALLKKEKDVRVVYTRTTDRYVTLNGRASIANKAKADLFVSIHCDAHNSNAYGAGTFVMGLHRNKDNFRISQKENSVIFLEDNYEQEYDGFDPNNPESVISLVLMQEDYLNQSIEAASFIQNSFVSNLKRKNRTVKQAGFLVLRNTYMPSVLVELGFLTNKKEENNAPGEVSHRQALWTATAATVGLGNIAGVAIAVSLGGPGATFWMILAGFFGMSLKFCECTLGVKYRVINEDGSVSGLSLIHISEPTRQAEIC
mgnify:CR=1 FL=1